MAELFTNPSVGNNNTFYVLSLKAKRLEVNKVDNFTKAYYLGLPEPFDVETFEWDKEEPEEDNFLRLELEQIKLVMRDEEFIEKLREMKFDIGIGGLSFNDALLFRELELPYIRLTEEDLEAYTM